jgi:hypothetical protein
VTDNICTSVYTVKDGPIATALDSWAAIDIAMQEGATFHPSSKLFVGPYVSRGDMMELSHAKR